MKINLEETLAKADEISNEAESVVINEDAVKRLASGIKIDRLKEETKDSEVNSKIEQEIKAKIYLAYNVMNFSFYPEKGKARWFYKQEDGNVVGRDDEAHAVVAALTDYQRKHPEVLDSADLMDELTLEDLEQIFKPADGAGKLPLLELRLKCLKSLAAGYRKLIEEEKEKGVSAIKILTERANESCEKFIEILCDYVPVFADVFEYKNKIEIKFLKRVQLLCSMLHSDKIIIFNDIEKLTVFADYKIPQYLRHQGVLEYSSELAAQVNKEEEIPSGSAEEIEIRAATISASALIKKEIETLHKVEVGTGSLDYYLWRTAVTETPKMKPHHRTRCCYY